MSLFGKKPNPKEQMRQQKRQLNRTQRELERDRMQIERDEKKLEAEIKKMARTGNKQACATLAKQLVQLRKQKAKNFGVASKVTAVGYQTQNMQSHVKMAGAMATTSKTMSAVNAAIKPEQVMKNMQDFERESMKMDMAGETIDETLDSILDESGDEEEQDAIVSQVLDEIGIEVSEKMADAPSAHTGKLPTRTKTKAKEVPSDDDIEAMLANLRS